MNIILNNKTCVIFDLDDTLYSELDYMKSGYKAVSEYILSIEGINIYLDMLLAYNNGMNVFETIIKEYNLSLTVNDLLKIYREHLPIISIYPDALQFINKLKNYNIPLGIITDGRGTSQRNKLKGLGIFEYFNDIIISEEFGTEKPNPNNYLYYHNKYSNYNFYFFGDNLKKDFNVPIELGWISFCLLDKGYNIHKQLEMENQNSISFIKSYNEINCYYEH